jgi:cell division protein ZapA (FtsZ GTPase activity inhibitor)
MKTIDQLSIEKIYFLTRVLIDFLEEELQEIKNVKKQANTKKTATIAATLTKLVALIEKLAQLESLDASNQEKNIESEDLKMLENYLKKYQRNGL